MEYLAYISLLLRCINTKRNIKFNSQINNS